MSDRKPLPTAESCETCRFWREYGKIQDPHRPDISQGECRRYPPTQSTLLHKSSDQYDWTHWYYPMLDGEEWCGEYKPATVAEPKANYRESQFLFSRVVDLPIGYGDRESKKLAQAIAEYYNSQPFAPGNLRPETLTVGELLHLSAKSLSKIKGVGEQTVQDLRAVLALHGYFLRGDYPTVAAPTPPVG